MSEPEQQPLEGATVGVFLAAEGSEEPEFTEPREAITDAGASVDVLGSEIGDAETVNNDLEPGGTYEIEKTFEEVTAEEYDALVVPGGTVGADTLRTDEEAVELVRTKLSEDAPVGVICHGPWILVEADVVDDRTLTSYHSLETDIRNAGGEWVDEEVVVDDGLITSRNPDDLEAFCETLVDEIASTLR
jgi:protease I